MELGSTQCVVIKEYTCEKVKLYILAFEHGCPVAVFKVSFQSSHSSSNSKRWMYQLFLSIAVIHERGFIHRNINSSNLLKILINK